MTESQQTLRDRYVEGLAFESTAWGLHRPPWLLRDTIEKIADALLAVRDDELAERDRHMDYLRADNTRLREESTRLRLNAEKDVCTGCMQREEQRDRWMEATRQNGVKFEQAKQAWYREQDHVARVRELAERWKHVSDRKEGPLRELLAALDVPADGEQTPTEHTGDHDA